jgi:hypothetical protein
MVSFAVAHDALNAVYETGAEQLRIASARIAELEAKIRHLEEYIDELKAQRDAALGIGEP